jgi:serine/threonine-protein kinase
MPTPTPAEFWSLLVGTRLVDAATAARLRVEVAALPGAADTRAIADWLVERGLITGWQRKRLVVGNEGPFFLGDYRLLERQESLGAALVFTARHEPSGNVVSLVRLDGQALRDPAVRRGVARRVTAAVAASDPALARTWALEESGRTRFVVSERVEGEPLSAELARRGRLPPEEAAAIALTVAGGVAAVHAAGDVHGGVSLDTVIREPPPGGGPGAGRVRLLHFPLTGDPHEPVPRPAVGTAEQISRLGRAAGFVAPELLQPGAGCTAASDVYAIGCLLHALVTGEVPCWRGDAAATLRAAAEAGPARLGPPDVPPELGALVSYLTARDPAARYAGAAEAARAIATCFGLPFATRQAGAPGSQPADDLAPAWPIAAPTSAGAGIDAPRPAPGSPRGPRAVRRRGHLAWLAAAAAACLGGVVVRLVSSRDGNPATEVAGRPVPAARQLDAAVPAPPPAARAMPRAVVPEDAAPDVRTAAPAVPPASASAPAVQEVDDPSLPWASPTTGPPPSLAYLPAGSQLILVVRVADLLGAGDEGRLFLRSLGPAVETHLRGVAAACGCEPADIERLHVGWQTDATGDLVTGWAAWLGGGRRLPEDEAWRERAWGLRRGEVYGGPWTAFWVPERAQGRVLVAAAREPLVALAGESGDDDPEPPPALPVELEQLRQTLDGARHLTLLGQPSFLLRGGAKLLEGPLARLAGPLDALVGESVPAAAVSLHFGGDFYAELDAVPTRDVQPAALAADLAARITGYPDAVEAWCASLDVHPHGRRLVLRLPGMLRALVANLRSGAERRQAVVNVRLPRHAGHNLALATELALAQRADAVVAGRAIAAAAPRTALARLAQPMTLEFAKDTLETAIQMISTEVELPMAIAGGDLQLEGITQNQSFALAERERPAEAILRVILAKADPDGRLIYVVRKIDGVESIVITTREAARKRGETPPPGLGPAAGVEEGAK